MEGLKSKRHFSAHHPTPPIPSASQIALFERACWALLCMCHVLLVYVHTVACLGRLVSALDHARRLQRVLLIRHMRLIGVARASYRQFVRLIDCPTL